MLAIIDLTIDAENVISIVLVNLCFPYLLFEHSINTIIHGVVNRLNKLHSPKYSTKIRPGHSLCCCHYLVKDVKSA
jgi:hypothetical protein